MYLNNLKPVLRHDADMSDCRRLLKNGSHSFFAASLLLPAEYRQPITALYAFCRVADDAIDLAAAPGAGLEELRCRLDRIYEGRPAASSVDRAFSFVVRRHGIPRALPEALLEGFAWDVERRRYQTLSDTYAYATRVAGTVGAMIAIVLGVRDTETLSRACDLGVAMQLTNIARDVGEDARSGRVYLPTERLAANGVAVDDWLKNPGINAGVRATVKELLDIADTLYCRAEWGIGQLPVSARPGIFAARTIYAEIGREVERRGYDSVSQRAVVPFGRKLKLLSVAVRMAMASRHRDEAPPLRETRFLLDAVAEAG